MGSGSFVSLIYGLDALESFFLKKLDEKVLFPARFRMLTNWLAPYLRDCQKILDVGSSDGRLAKCLQAAVGGEFIGVDVLVQPNPAIQVERYDGKRLPFEQKLFDCVMMIDMLHHAENQGELLAEARRVSRKYILIKDHYWKNWLDFQVLKIADYIGNKPYGVNLPYRYKTLEAWEQMFRRHGLKEVKRKVFRFTPIDPTKQVIFKLTI